MKEKIELPKRSDDIYKEIENFEDYEYTNCIAYEMAIRNDDYFRLYNDFFENKKDENYKILKNDLLISPFDVSRFEYFRRLENKKEYLNFSEWEKEYVEINLKNSKTKKIDSNKIIKKNKWITTDSYKTKDRHGKERVHQSIRNTFSRPSLNIDFRSRFKLEINLNFPEDEIIEYVKKIKKEYDSENSIIHNPFSNSLQYDKADDNPLINSRTGKIDKIRVADMFFIYDRIKQGMKKSQIQLELSYYHEKGMYDNKTINKYLEIAKEYIDNLKYKELITGVKE